MLVGKDSSAATSVVTKGVSPAWGLTVGPRVSWLQHPGRKQGNVSQEAEPCDKGLPAVGHLPHPPKHSLGPNPHSGLCGIKRPHSALSTPAIKEGLTKGKEGWTQGLPCITVSNVHGPSSPVSCPTVRRDSGTCHR